MLVDRISIGKQVVKLGRFKHKRVENIRFKCGNAVVAYNLLLDGIREHGREQCIGIGRRFHVLGGFDRLEVGYFEHVANAPRGLARVKLVQKQMRLTVCQQIGNLLI